MKSYIAIAIFVLVACLLICTFFLGEHSYLRPVSTSKTPHGNFSEENRESLGEPTPPGEPTAVSTSSRTIRGQVLDEERKPLSHVDITVVRMQFPNTTLTVEQTTQSDGLFYFNLDAEQTYTLEARKEGWIPYFGHGEYDTPDPNLIMKRRGKLIGCVEDENGNPVESAKVLIQACSDSISSASESGALKLVTRTHSDGTFETREELPSGTYRVSAEQDGFRDLGKGHIEIPLQSPPEEIVLGLTSQVLELSGKVEERRTGKGIPGMNLVLWAWGFGGAYSGQMGEAVSDEAGVFHFANLPPGEYLVAGVNPEDGNDPWRFVENNRQVLIALRKPLVDPLVLYAAAKMQIQGIVVDENQNPVGDVLVLCGDSGENETRTDGDGNFTLFISPKELKQPSRFRLMAFDRIETGNRYAVSEDLESHDGQSIEKVKLVLKHVSENGIKVKGRILSRSGNPIPGATLQLENRLTSEIEEIKSNEPGEYEFEKVLIVPLRDNESDMWILRAEMSGFAPVIHVLHPQPGQKEYTHDVILDLPSKIAGRVVDAENRPLEGVHVFASQPGCSGIWQSTRSDGHYVFENLSPGKYDLLFQYSQRPLLAGYLRGIWVGNDHAGIKLTFHPVTLNVNLEMDGEIDRSRKVFVSIYKKGNDGSLKEQNGIANPLVSPSFSMMVWEPGTYQVRCCVAGFSVTSTWVVIDEVHQGNRIVVTLPIGLPAPMSSIKGIIKQVEGFPCRFVEGPLQNRVQVEGNGQFRSLDVPTGEVSLILWLYDQETGMPIRVPAWIAQRIEGGREIDMGEIPVNRYFDRSAFHR